MTETHQYSVTEYAVPFDPRTQAAAAIDFWYDISPVLLEVRGSAGSALHYLVRLCAVVGGAFALTRWADKLVDRLLSRYGGCKAW